MGKARQTGNLVSENLITVDPTTDTIQVGAAVTIYGGSTGIVSARQFSGNATSATDSTNAANIGITNDVSTNATRYLTFVSGTTGNNATNVSSTKLTFNPLTGTVGVTSLTASSTVRSGTIEIGSGIVTATSGIITYYGDGSQLRGVSGGSGSFNTGISSNVAAVLTGIGTTVFTFPSTAGRRYIVYSINAANIAVGNTEVNVIGAYNFSGTGNDTRNYFAWNIPIPTGTAVELLKQPMILNPSDAIVMRSTDFVRAGIETAVEVYMVYQESTDINFFGIGAGNTNITGIGTTTIYRSSTNPSVIQSIRITNITDTGDYPVTIMLNNGGVRAELVDNLMIPKYSAVEILETPKRLNTGGLIEVQVDQVDTVEIQISGKVITG
jgi:hypothetical protein